MDGKRFKAIVGTSARLIVIVVLAISAALPGKTTRAGGGPLTLYVKSDGVTTGTCSSWAIACSLTYALHTVATPGYQIWVAKGVYKPTTDTTRTSIFLLKNGVALYGGFLGITSETSLSQRNWITNETILSGEIGLAGAADNSYHVVMGLSVDATAVLDGFTIKEGNANGASENAGGGIYNAGASPTLSNLRFVSNAAVMGGGVYNTYASSPTLTNVTFGGNSVSNNGGGMFNDNSSSPVLTDVTFSGNTAGNSGGGMFNDNSSGPTLTNVTFIGNAADYGGGISSDRGSNPHLTNVIFAGNSATAHGGGMSNSISNPILANVAFSGNSADYTGGGLYNYSSSPSLTNVTFSSNSAVFDGGALYNYSSSSPSLKNVTFGGNTAASSGGAMYNHVSSVPLIVDSIFWGDSAPEIVNSPSASSTIVNSIVAGGCPAGSTCTKITNADPKLGLLAINGGFTPTMALGSGSAAIDKGNTATCASTDQRGVLRPQGPACDMGAYEVQVKTFVSVAAYDGYVLESGETTGVGGTANSAAVTFRLGDDASNRQFRAILSFNTAALPDWVVPVRAQVKIMKQGLTGVNPFSNHGTLRVDVRRPYFGPGLGLAITDFQAAATAGSAGSIGSQPASGWYTGPLSAAGLAALNKIGTTQLRLRFNIDDDNDLVADYLSFYSSNATTASYRPRLIVYYNP